MLTELFTAESKLQVYAAFHELLNNHTTIANNLMYVLVLKCIRVCVPFVLETRVCFINGRKGKLVVINNIFTFNPLHLMRMRRFNHVATR